MKNRIILIAILMATTFLLSAQTPSFVWAKSTGGTDSDKGRSLAQDAQGNIYVAGQFEGTVDFDPGPGVTNLVCSGASNYFILKLDPDGNLIWARQLETGLTSSFISLAVDASANVYVAGTFSQSGDFDPGPGTFNMTSAGQSDAFLVKLLPDGSFNWAIQIGDTQQDEGNTVAVDPSGNVFLTGRYDDTVDFDPGAGVYEITSQGSSDGYILKLNSNGAFQWVAPFEGLGSSMYTNHSMAIDGSGNIYLTGSFFTTADMDPGAGVLEFSSQGGRDVFILKLNTAGSLVWARQIGGTGVDHSISIYVDAADNVYTCGTFSGTADFDPGAGEVLLSPTSGGDDNFLLKLDDSGNYAWAKVFNPVCTNVWVDANQDVYVTGVHLGSTDMDPGSGIFNLISVNSSFDAFVLKLNANGDFQWAGSAGGPGTDIGGDILLNPGGEIYTLGYFEQTSDFNPDAIETFDITSSGDEDVFIMKWGELTTQSIEVSSFDSYLVYPNPTYENIFLESKYTKLEGTVFVWDAYGKLIMSYPEIEGQTMEIQLPTISGCYYIQLITIQKESATWKVMKL